MLETVTLAEPYIVLVSIGTTFGVVVAFVLCLCCFRSHGFKEFSEESGDEEVASPRKISPTPGGQYTMYAPPPTNRRSSHEPVTFEPLPHPQKLLGDSFASLRPRIAPLNKERLGTEALQESFNYEFPREQLLFVKELGTGWFGKVLQGEAQKITVGLRRSKVAVKMLDTAATPEDKVDFLLDNAPYRELDHPNVVRLLGQCIENMPLLMIMEYFTLGDLKSYLLNRRNERSSMSQKGTSVKFARDMAAGLYCLHEHHFVHNDFALRNCMVAMDLSIKVGDYGIAEDLYQADYYGDEFSPVPLRWSAPETVHRDGDHVTIQNISREANVWSFGVALWELVEFGRQPYPDMTDEEVLENVIAQKSYKLPLPESSMKDKNRMYEIMLFCWDEAAKRPSVSEIHALLNHLFESTETDEFEEKWNNLLPKTSTEVPTGDLLLDFPINFKDKAQDHESDSMENLFDGHGRTSIISDSSRINGNIIEDTSDDLNKVIVNPNFEDTESDIDSIDLIDETPRPTAFQDVAGFMKTNDNLGLIDFPVGSNDFEVFSDPNDESTPKIKRGNFGTSAHRQVTDTPVEQSIDSTKEDSCMISEFEKSRTDSYVTVDSSMPSPPDSSSYSVGDFNTPVGSLEMETVGRLGSLSLSPTPGEVDRAEEDIIKAERASFSSGSWPDHKISPLSLLPTPGEVDRAEEDIITAERASFSSGSWPDRKISPHVLGDSWEKVPSDSSQTSEERSLPSLQAARKVSEILDTIHPPSYSPSESPGLQSKHDECNSLKHSDSSESKSDKVTVAVTTSDQPSDDSGDDVTLGRKLGTAYKPDDVPRISPSNTKNSDILNKVSVDVDVDPDKGQILDPDVHEKIDDSKTGSLEKSGTLNDGTDSSILQQDGVTVAGPGGKTYRRKSSLRTSNSSESEKP